jgi:hypothetical protein
MIEDISIYVTISVTATSWWSEIKKCVWKVFLFALTKIEIGRLDTQRLTI